MLYLTKFFVNEYETKTVMLINPVFKKCQLFLIKSRDKCIDGSNEPHPSAI